jgi:hypothetical protein
MHRCSLYRVTKKRQVRRSSIRASPDLGPKHSPPVRDGGLGGAALRRVDGAFNQYRPLSLVTRSVHLEQHIECQRSYRRYYQWIYRKPVKPLWLEPMRMKGLAEA